MILNIQTLGKFHLLLSGSIRTVGLVAFPGVHDCDVWCSFASLNVSLHLYLKKIIINFSIFFSFIYKIHMYQLPINA